MNAADRKYNDIHQSTMTTITTSSRMLILDKMEGIYKYLGFILLCFFCDFVISININDINTTVSEWNGTTSGGYLLTDIITPVPNGNQQDTGKSNTVNVNQMKQGDFTNNHDTDILPTTSIDEETTINSESTGNHSRNISTTSENANRNRSNISEVVVNVNNDNVTKSNQRDSEKVVNFTKGFKDVGFDNVDNSTNFGKTTLTKV